MIVSEIFYGLKCNRCQEQFEYGEHSFWGDEDSAIEYAMDSEWLEEKGKHYCPDCYDYNDEFESQSIKPDFPKHVKELKQFFDKMVRGRSNSIIENQDCFIISKTLQTKSKLDYFEEDYIKEMLGDKLISIDHTKYGRYDQVQCTVKVKK